MGKLIGAIGPEGRTLIPNKEMEAPEKEPGLDRLLTEIEQVAERGHQNACDELALAISGGVVEEGDDIPTDPYKYLGWYFIERMDSSKFERLKEEFLELTDEIIAQEELRDLCAEIRGEKDPSNRERLVNTLHAILMQESNDTWEKRGILRKTPKPPMKYGKGNQKM